MAQDNDLRKVEMKLTLDDRVNAEILRARLGSPNKASATSVALALARFLSDEMRMPIGTEILLRRPNGDLDLVSVEGFTDVLGRLPTFPGREGWHK